LACRNRLRARRWRQDIAASGEVGGRHAGLSPSADLAAQPGLGPRKSGRKASESSRRSPPPQPLSHRASRCRRSVENCPCLPFARPSAVSISELAISPRVSDDRLPTALRGGHMSAERRLIRHRSIDEKQ
jgi:hypothetical protein